MVERWLQNNAYDNRAMRLFYDNSGQRATFALRGISVLHVQWHCPESRVLFSYELKNLGPLRSIPAWRNVNHPRHYYDKMETEPYFGKTDNIDQWIKVSS